MGFLLIGWALMPDHFHLRIKPEPAANTSRFMQELKKRTAQRILSALSENQRLPWCAKMLARLRLLPTVHTDSQFLVWQRRFYRFGVYSEKKRREKLNYAHGNAMKNGASQLSLPVTCHSPLAIALVGGGSGIGSSLVPPRRATRHCFLGRGRASGSTTSTIRRF